MGRVYNICIMGGRGGREGRGGKEREVKGRKGGGEWEGKGIIV